MIEIFPAKEILNSNCSNHSETPSTDNRINDIQIFEAPRTKTDEVGLDPDHPSEKLFGRHCSYMDCLCDRAPVPHHGNGEVLFKVLMCGCMVAAMTTINGLRNTGLAFIESSLWLYPLTFCIALSLRLILTDHIIGHLRRRLIEPNFSGISHGMAMTVMNTLVTSPIMCAIVTLLLVGPDDFWTRYITTLPITAPLSMVVSYFFVAPAVKIFFNNRLTPVQGVHLLEDITEKGAPVARMMGLS